MLGEINYNRYGTPMKIIRYGSSNDIDVMFMDEHNYIVKHAVYQNFKKGNMKNPYDKSVYGIGYLGVGEHQTKINNKRVRAYNIWHSMIGRCYEESRSHIYEAYYDICTVSSKWLCYQNFADWFESNKYECEGRLHLDKDILYPGNKIYSPDTCLLVPQRINMLFTNKENSRGLPNGIMQVNDKYSAKYNNIELGIYDSLEEAYAVYAIEKEKHIKQVADEYKDKIPEYVYEALYRYKVDIRNDKNLTAA